MDVALFGSVAMWMAAGVALLGVAASVADPTSRVSDGGTWPARSRAARALGGVAVLSSVSVACLAWALVTGDYRLVYVAEASSRSAWAPFRLAGLWGGMAGSLLFWTWLLSLVAAAAVRSVRRVRPDLEASVGAVLATLVGAFLVIGLAWADPFDRLAIPAIDGAGLAPILEHPAMLYHPPLLYFGLVSCAVPFALAVAALVRRPAGAGSADLGSPGAGSPGVARAWLAVVRQWAGLAWLLLTVGMLAGAHWAYVELGWGGFWAWDPVENAALLPWLGATALVHAAMVDEHRGRVRSSTVALALGTFVIALVGTMLTRSGAVSSVHSFAEAVAVGRAPLVLVVVVAAASAFLVWRARPPHQDRPPPGDRDRRAPSTAQALQRPSPGWLTRPRVLGLNAVVVLGVAVVVAWGTLFPLVAELAGGRAFAVNGRFFALLSAPLALAGLALVGVAPVLRWRGGVTPGGRHSLPWAAVLAVVALVAAHLAGLRAPFALATVPLATGSAVLLGAELVRRLRAPGRPRTRCRAAGAVLAHLGVVVFLAGVAGATTGQTATVVLAPGEETGVAGYALRHDGVAVSNPTRSGDRNGGIPAAFRNQNEPEERLITMEVALRRGNDLVATLHPEQAVYEARGLVLAETALRSTPVDDVLVAIRQLTDDGTAVLEVSVRPLAVWVWWGWILVATGGALALLGPRRATTVDRVVPAPPACAPGDDRSSPVASAPPAHLAAGVAAAPSATGQQAPGPVGPAMTAAGGPTCPPLGQPPGAGSPSSPKGPGG